MDVGKRDTRSESVYKRKRGEKRKWHHHEQYGKR